MKNQLILAFLICSSIVNGQVQSFFELPLFENGKNGYSCYRIPAIIQAPNKDILAFSEGRKHGCSDFGDVDIVLRRSQDGGLSWAEPEVVLDNDTVQAGNPAPVVDLMDPEFPNGRIFLFYNTGNNHESEVRKGNGVREIWFITSTDNGNTWSNPSNITMQVHKPLQPSFNLAYIFKEDWRSYANTPGHAIQLMSGRIFVPANHSEGAPQQGFNEYRAHAFFSDDHGKTWQLGASVDHPSSNESIAVQLPNGYIMQNIREQNGSSRNRLVALSSDEGVTWDKIYLDTNLISPVCQASLIGFKAPDGKNLLLFSNPASKEKREKMTIKASFDQGKSWPVSRLVRQGPSAYSDLLAISANEIGLLYEHGNNGGIFFSKFNYWWIIGGNN